MALFKMPTKDELTQAITSRAAKTKRMIEENLTFAEQMDRLTDTELEALGYTTGEVAYIRSACVAFKNLELRYQMQEPLNTDSIVYFIEYMLTVRNF